MILDDTTDESYQNFKKGVDRAAIELNADVSLITLYEGGDARQQIERMAREQQDGVKALIVMPVAENELEEALAEKRFRFRWCWSIRTAKRQGLFRGFTADFDAMGRNLAKQVLEEHGNSIPVYLFYSHRESAARQHFQDGVETVLQSGKCEIKSLNAMEMEHSARQSKNWFIRSQPGPSSLPWIRRAFWRLRQSWRTAAYIRNSGRSLWPGTTTPVLNYLDRGVINGLCVTDDFSTGYLSVKRAVEILANQKLEEETVLDSYYIQRTI